MHSKRAYGGSQGNAGIGLSGPDMSNTVWHERGALVPSTSRGGGQENARPLSPPLIQTHSCAPTISRTSPRSTLSPTYKANNRLRLADNSPTSPARRLPAPPTLTSRTLLALFPHRVLPTSVTDTVPFQYPKSPSLSRDPPSKRHGRRRGVLGSPRRNGIVALLVVLALLLYLSPRPARWASRREEGGREEIEVTGQEQRPGQSERIPDPLRYFTAKPEEAERVDYAAELEKLRNGGGLKPVLVEPLPLRVVVKEDGGSPHTDEEAPFEAGTEEGEEEEAGLADIVSQAAEEHASKAAEVQERLAMAKVVKPAAAVVDNLKAEAKAVKKKDPSRYKRLLPLGVPPRRYLYGANFVLSPAEEGEEETVVEDPQRQGKKVKVPSKKKLERIFREGKERYEEEEEGWREWEWEAPEPHVSLKRFVAKLEPDELALRAWIKRLHHEPVSGGVGLGSSSSTSPFPPSSSSDELALASSVPDFDRGSLEKYADLLLQAEAGHSGKCQWSTWLAEYQRMHAEMLAGERKPKFISYHCEQGVNCGGLGDRLLGMTSAFFFGLMTERAFLAEWQSPIPLDVVFSSPHIDWSYSSFTSSQHPVLGSKDLVDASAELDIIHFDRLSVDATFGTTSWNPKPNKRPTQGFERRDLAYQSPWIKFFTNRGMIHRSFRYKHLQKNIKRLGLQPATAFSCISQYLFQPKPPAIDLISEYTSVLALPTVFSVGIHVRTGDKSMKDLEWDKVNTVKRHSQFFRCARELSETYASPSQKILFYLVTDSAHLKADAQRVYGDRILVTGTRPQHVHQKSGHAEGVMSAVVEDWVLAKTDMLVATQDSGFGKLAAFMHAKENTTVTIFPRYNPDVMGLQSKKSHLKVDCTRPDVFASFEELSSEWSLG
ncbi:hypothetical protein JCM8547_007653 [Rhodosporidiobolus lusitaniae]